MLGVARSSLVSYFIILNSNRYMLDLIKQINQLRSLQSDLKQQQFAATVNGVTVAVNGAMKIVNIELNPTLDIDAQSLATKTCVNTAFAKVQQHLATLMAKS